MRKMRMKITAGLGSVEEYERFVRAGADEFFSGYVPYEWAKKYGTVMPLNRREVLAYNVQIGSFSEMEILSAMVKEYGRPVHLTFNSLSQYERFHERVATVNPNIKLGLRVNPEYSEVETLLYNPCAPGSRFGVTADKLPETLPSDIEGFHCHCHCESGADVFERTLVHIEEKFGKWFSQLKWINFGGGHLMTRKDYDVLHLINIIKEFHLRYPHLHVIMEPGSAFGWQTGPLVSQVVDVVEDHGYKTAILDVSFTCHMPDCLEMPYHPAVRNAETIEMEDMMEKPEGDYVYRLGGNSCLSGDFMGYWKFDHELEVGEKVIFEDMLHYTTVKTNTFNGITHPSIGIVHLDGNLEILREYGYEDYLNRMD